MNSNSEKERVEAELNKIKLRSKEGQWVDIWYKGTQIYNADTLGLSETDVEEIIEEIKKQMPDIKEDSLYSFGSAMKDGIKYYESHDMPNKAIELCKYVIETGLLPNDTFYTWKLEKLGGLDEKTKNAGYDIAYQKIEAQKKANLDENLYGMYRNCVLDEYNLNCNNERYEDAFRNLSEIIYIDLSGVDNNFDLRFVENSMEFSFPYINDEGRKSLSTIPPAAITWIKQSMVRLNLSEDEFRRKLIENMKMFKLPFHYFTIEECADICTMELHNDEKGLMKLYDEAYERNKSRIR